MLDVRTKYEEFTVTFEVELKLAALHRHVLQPVSSGHGSFTAWSGMHAVLAGNRRLSHGCSTGARLLTGLLYLYSALPATTRLFPAESPSTPSSSVSEMALSLTCYLPLDLGSSGKADMPLIVLCGQPSSGKSSVTSLIEQQLQQQDKAVVVISEQSLHQERNLAYQGSSAYISVQTCMQLIPTEPNLLQTPPVRRSSEAA